VNRFYFDLASPECWLAAERVLSEVPQPCEWVPVRREPRLAFRCAEEESIWRMEFERRARKQGLQPVVWPPNVPFDSDFAMRAATYAKTGGKAVAFALAAFRQAYCAGRDLSVPENVLIAAAACEIHPRALLKAAGTRSIAERLEAATAEAPDEVPAVVLDEAQDPPDLSIWRSGARPR
jgi:2-hydroxychromene-2-carboxylate isomerase